MVADSVRHPGCRPPCVELRRPGRPPLMAMMAANLKVAQRFARRSAPAALGPRNGRLRGGRHALRPSPSSPDGVNHPSATLQARVVLSMVDSWNAGTRASRVGSRGSLPGGPGVTYLGSIGRCRGGRRRPPAPRPVLRKGQLWPPTAPPDPLVARPPGPKLSRIGGYPPPPPLAAGVPNPGQPGRDPTLLRPSRLRGLCR